MLEHAADVLTLMTWAFSTVGSALVAVITWGGLKIIGRLEAIEALLATETRDLREAIAHIDKRVALIEERCSMMHEEPKKYVSIERRNRQQENHGPERRR